MLKKNEIIEVIKEDMSSDDYRLKNTEVIDMIESVNDMIELILDTMRERGEENARFGNLVLSIVTSKDREYTNPRTGEKTTLKGKERIKITYNPEKTSRVIKNKKGK